MKKSFKKNKEWPERLFSSTWNASTQIPLRSKSVNRRDNQD